MVKRQTVWLSTMMVLSLMLIGYYTMNSGATTTTSGDGTQGSVTTTTTGPPATSTPAASSESTPPAAPTGSDWYYNAETKLQQQLTGKEGSLTQVIGNPNASTQQISQAQQQLREVQSLDGALAQAREAVLAENYKDCVILPAQNGATAQVYVQTAHLTSEDAVKVMNIVSQQLNIPINNVVVHEHS